MKLSELIKYGTRVNQPDPGIAGRLYCVTDESNIVEIDSGTTWEEYSTSGGGGSLTDTYANIPAASTDGGLFLPSDGYYIYRDTGAAWVPWGPIFPLTAPPTSGWSWVNQGSASVSSAKGSITMTVPPNGSGNAVRAYVRSTPTAPYTITAAMLMTYPPGQSGVNPALGLTWRQSSDGKLVMLWGHSKDDTVTSLRVTKWDNETTPVAHYYDRPFQNYMAFGAITWMQITDNNTSRICRISSDGINWTTIHTVGRTDYMTANQAGIIARFDASSGDYVHINLLSWKES